MHLWEIEHPYFCSDHNYYVSPVEQQQNGVYADWEAFVADWGVRAWAYDETDSNLIFRWDWHTAERLNEGYAVSGDDAYRHDRLELFFMLQRKGLYRPVMIERMDRRYEPEVRAFLELHARKLAELWAPLGLGAAA